MAFYTPLSQDQLFGDFSTAYADAAELTAELDAVSTVGAIGTGVARVGERLDTQVEYVASIARLATSSPDLNSAGVSPDVASWALPFGVTPIGAVAATTTVVLSTASPVMANYPISPGQIVATQSGIQFVVIPSTLSGYVGDAYVIPAESQSVVALVQCLTAGSIGNVEPGTIDTLVSTTLNGTITALYSVTNTNAVTNGKDGETDGAFIERFTLTQKSGRVGTAAAILSAVASVQTGLTYQFGDCINIDGSPHAAHFTIVVDVLGSAGGPGTTLLDEIAAAVDGGTGPSGTVYPEVIGAGTTRDILPPSEVPINVTATLKLANGAVGATVIAAAESALSAYLDNFPLSAGVSSATIVPYSEVIAQLLAVTGVAYPSDIEIGAGSGPLGFTNISVGFGSRAVAGTLTFTSA